MIRINEWLFFIFLLCCAPGVFGGSPSEKAFPFPYTEEDLPNGLRLVTVPTGFPNIVSLFIVVRTGSRNEVEPGKSGYAHLFEHLMFRGTPSYPAEKYTAMVKAAGADQNANTGADLTTYHTTFSKEDLDTMLMLEADRFQNLKYSPEVFKTETLAVLGEYNKNSSDPGQRLFETLLDTAFLRHTYKHDAMGFLKDVEDMPNQYDYGIEFFHRYYRPEYTTMIVAGDVSRSRVRPAVDRYWGRWKRGNYRANIPAEPPQDGPRSAQVDWPSPTLPWLAIAFHAPAYSDLEPDWAALSLLSYLGFSANSELYQRLVIQEQKVDRLDGDMSSTPDPFLFTVTARVKKPEDVRYVQEQALATLKGFADTAVNKDRLDAVKQHLRYRFSLSLNNTEAIASAVARSLRASRTPDTINRVYDQYARISPEDIQRVASKYFTPKNRTIVTLSGPGASISGGGLP
jgi:zinc protease